MLWCSQVATGNENALRLRVYGEKGGLEWAQEDPNYLWYTPLGEPKRLLTRGGAGAGAEAARVSRTPGGHPEGYLEGFANIYAEAARAIRARRERQAGAEGRGLPDDRGRRRGRRLRRGLRAVLGARTGPGSRRDRAAPRARGWRAARTRAAPAASAAGAGLPARPGRSPISVSASAIPTRVEVGVEVRERRHQRAGVDRREGADHRHVACRSRGRAPRGRCRAPPRCTRGWRGSRSGAACPIGEAARAAPAVSRAVAGRQHLDRVARRARAARPRRRIPGRSSPRSSARGSLTATASRRWPSRTKSRTASRAIDFEVEVDEGIVVDPGRCGRRRRSRRPRP